MRRIAMLVGTIVALSLTVAARANMEPPPRSESPYQWHVRAGTDSLWDRPEVPVVIGAVLSICLAGGGLWVTSRRTRRGPEA